MSSYYLVRWDPRIYDYQNALNDVQHCRSMLQSIGHGASIPRQGDKFLVMLTRYGPLGGHIVAKGEVLSDTIQVNDVIRDRYDTSPLRPHASQHIYVSCRLEPFHIIPDDLAYYHSLKYLRATFNKLNELLVQHQQLIQYLRPTPPLQKTSPRFVIKIKTMNVFSKQPLLTELGLGQYQPQ